ncbi:hypothetical protein KGF57_002033 [Candida theae]|uniref:SHSP domain-containing protein n=1 Tax=Candida theae TaxID=1198502 RepID=A0AAD5BGL0_9ASCO|nr:uncharacterized protein KGF57_002033 [Candida theae]KAI5959696.1 hypothetical protein KGF57_002033 [Candida theae]
MLSSWGNYLDHELDKMMSRPRKYVNSVPPQSNPRRIVQRHAPGKIYQSSEEDREGHLALSSSRHPRGSELWHDDHQFVDDFWDKFSSGKYFIGFDDSLHSKEKDDKYMVSYDDPGLKQDEVKVDFNEEDNELVIHVDHEDHTDSSASIKTYQSAVRFEKPIKAQEIKAEIDDNGIQLVLPKVHADDEYIHHVVVTRRDNNSLGN